jgi:hypothetical protein
MGLTVNLGLCSKVKGHQPLRTARANLAVISGSGYEGQGLPSAGRLPCNWLRQAADASDDADACVRGHTFPPGLSVRSLTVVTRPTGQPRVTCPTFGASCLLRAGTDRL